MKIKLRKNNETQFCELDPKKTAVIICDMWDRHWCAGATARVGELAPRINEFISKAREAGMLIIHAPSDTMDFYVNDNGYKALAKQELFPLKPNLGGEEPFPLDCSDGGCDCDPHCSDVNKKYWSRQHKSIEIRDGDLIGDDSRIICYLLSHGYENTMICGVHANMCVVGRSFALKQLVANGINAMLVRDLTDAMYNHDKAPYINHFDGNDVTVEWIERNLAPSLESTELTGLDAFRFSEDKR